MRNKLLAIIAILLFSSCSPKLYPLESTKEIVYVDRVSVDSLYVRDSIFVKEKNDTITIYKEKIKEKYKYIHDTTMVYQTDTLRMVETREVVKPLTKWQSFEMACGDISLIVVALLAIALIVRSMIVKIL